MNSKLVENFFFMKILSSESLIQSSDLFKAVALIFELFFLKVY